MFRTKRILVTGGAGFLGSFLCDSLIADGHEVICLDNFHTGSRLNVHHLCDEPRFEIMRHDVTMPIHAEVDEIFNLACPASPVHYQTDPVQTVKTNVHGAINVLDLARRLKVRVFQASTSEVYGNPLVHPQVESYAGNVNPIGHRACYDEGKRCAETLFFDFHRQYGLEIRVARIFNTYGPRMLPDDGRVVSNFIVQALRGDPLSIYGDGRQTRSFCFVDDLVRGFRALMDAPESVPMPINLGNPSEFTIRQLADLVIQMTGSRSIISHHPLPRDDPAQRRPDITRARQHLDWQPMIGLTEGLRRTIDYFEDRLSQGAPMRRIPARALPDASHRPQPVHANGGLA